MAAGGAKPLLYKAENKAKQKLENAKKKRNNIRYKACIERGPDYTGLRIGLRGSTKGCLCECQ